MTGSPLRKGSQSTSFTPRNIASFDKDSRGCCRLSRAQHSEGRAAGTTKHDRYEPSMRRDDKRHRLHTVTTMDDAFTGASLTRPIMNPRAGTSFRRRRGSPPISTCACLRTGVVRQRVREQGGGWKVYWVTRRDGLDRVCIASSGARRGTSTIQALQVRRLICVKVQTEYVTGPKQADVSSSPLQPCDTTLLIRAI
jgi:hypothetical protein